ncbi:MAG: SH3 domain-containing protein [Calditrichae bacterium]|nr:SH3 domain-containing protein [Calditrichia bacterium]
MKVIVIAALIAAMLTFANNFFQKDERIFDAEPYPTKLIHKTDLFSNHFDQGTHEEWASISIGTAAAGTPVKVMEPGRLQWYKIQLADGTMGWVPEENLQASKEGLIRRARNKHVHLWDNLDFRNRKTIKEVNGREWVTRLETASPKLSRGGTPMHFSRIRTEDGTSGWVDDYDIERVGWKQPRLIDRQEWRFNKSAFLADWQGKPVDEFIQKFAEPAAIQHNNGRDIYFFNNIFLYDGDRKEMGIQAIARSGVIEEIGRTGRVTKWIGYFPLSEALRIPFVINHIWGIFDLAHNDSYDNYGDAISRDLFDMPGWAKFIIAIVFIGIFLALFYIILYVPYFVTEKIAYRISLNRKLNNGIIGTIGTVGAIVLGYLYFVFVNVNIGVFNNWFLLHFLFALGMTVGFIGKWRNDLLYQRCQRCRYWSGTDNGSDLVSRTHKTLTTTYSSGRKTVDHGTAETWIDHRLCANNQCGFSWDVVRNYFSGWSRN